LYGILGGIESAAMHRSVLRSEKNKTINDGHKYLCAAWGHLQDGPGSLPGGDNTVGHKVSWANRTKQNSVEPKDVKASVSASGSQWQF